MSDVSRAVLPQGAGYGIVVGQCIVDLTQLLVHLTPHPNRNRSFLHLLHAPSHLPANALYGL